jgi:hypothetical protein
LINGGVDITKKPVWIEGPHVMKRNDWYILYCAEGGTSVNHSQVALRSKDIWGPYVPFEGNPVLTQRELPADRPKSNYLGRTRSIYRRPMAIGILYFWQFVLMKAIITILVVKCLLLRSRG